MLGIATAAAPALCHVERGRGVRTSDVSNPHPDFALMPTWERWMNLNVSIRV
ncbi:MAG: hypothetical protein JWR79_1616 [Tardiphaga sp.]|nr:hypothetical protein [Tardiphaga sp.]